MSRYPPLDVELTKSSPQLWALRPLFSAQELQVIAAARQQISAGARTVVFATYENRGARAGGLYAVAERLPSALARAGVRAVCLSPFHSRLRKAPDRPGEMVGQVDVPFDGRRVQTTIYRDESGSIPWILFGAPGFFDAAGGPNGADPYDHSSPAGPAVDSNSLLLRDSLFAAAALPHVLAYSEIVHDVVVHVQDWQFAAAALTVKQAILAGRLSSAAVVLSSHNPYDCSLTAADLAKITTRTADRCWPRPEHEYAANRAAHAPDIEDDVAADGRRVAERSQPLVGDPTRNVAPQTSDAGAARTRRGTVYECMIPLCDAPVATVSREFARDLVRSLLQRSYFAGHLQRVFALRGLVGIDNGLFLEPRCPFSSDAIDGVSRGDFAQILAEKNARRARMLEILAEYSPAARIGELSDSADRGLPNLSDQTPIFMMFGRLDPGQKGFDVLAQAVRTQPRGAAKFVVCPIVPAGAEAFLDQWRQVADERAGDVVVFPFRMEAGYFETMAGATFCVMPSLYEPFGAATEPYLQGTPVVAHATGGLVQQVLDVREHPSEGTGILFRPQAVDTDEQAGRQWRAILQGPGPEHRMQYPLYVALVHELAGALAAARAVYQQDQPAYARMLSRLYPQSLEFAWDRAAAEYLALYEAAVRRG